LLNGEISRAPTAEHSAHGIAGTIRVVLRRIVRKLQYERRLRTASFLLRRVPRWPQ
jgi:hypothetical protein